MRVPADLLDILITGGGGDEAEGVVRARLHAVDCGGLRPLCQRLHPRLHGRVASYGVGGRHDILGGIFHIGARLRHDALAGLHQALRVGDAGAHLEQDRGVELLAELKGQHGKFPRLSGIGGLQHRNLGGHGIVAGVLLVLAGVHTRVVGHGDDHAAVDAGVGHGEQRVGSHVQADMLHAAEAAPTGQGRAEGDLHRNLLVGGPLAADLVVGSAFLGDFGAGRAGVAGNQADPRLIETAGRRLVA